MHHKARRDAAGGVADGSFNLGSGHSLVTAGGSPGMGTAAGHRPDPTKNVDGAVG